MKINTHVPFAGLIFVFFYLLFIQWSDTSLTQLNDHSDYQPKALSNINQKYQDDFRSFLETSISFKNATKDFLQKKKSIRELKKEYRQLRDQFKQVEFIIAYLDKEAFDKIINGAPLPKLEKKVADITVLEPEGFQVIDEIMGSNQLDDLETQNTLFSEVQQLEKNINKLYKFLSPKKITDRQFFEAARLSVIRLATLGITGFDTPGTTQGIGDTEVVLNVLKTYLQLYKTELKNVNRIDLLKTIDTILVEGISLCKSSNFENFDRLTFIKTTVNQAYKTIKDIHLALQYETIDEVSRFTQALNYKSDNLFASDFLNPFFYVSLPNDTTFNEKAALGKLLFYDPILSFNNEMSCATCHNPKKAFTDGKRLSLSNTGNTLKRNAMTLNYSVYATRFFHDLRATNLENQFEHVVVSDDEFNTSYKEIISKINTSTNYKTLFNKAFPETQNRPIITNDLDYALTAYVMTLNTFDSPIDQYFQNKISDLPEPVKNGFNLFAGKAACATCHFTPLFSGNLPPLFTDSEAEVLGVPQNKEEPWTIDDDFGRLGNGVVKDKANFYESAFKTPTIRNIELSGPYMHNGVFDSLEEVMDFYNKGGGAGGGMELAHQTLASDPLNLSEQEIADIIAFMKALTDSKSFEAPKEIPRDFNHEKLNKRSF